MAMEMGDFSVEKKTGHTHEQKGGLCPILVPFFLTCEMDHFQQSAEVSNANNKSQMGAPQPKALCHNLGPHNTKIEEYIISRFEPGSQKS